MWFGLSKHVYSDFRTRLSTQWSVTLKRRINHLEFVKLERSGMRGVLAFSHPLLLWFVAGILTTVLLCDPQV